MTELEKLDIEKQKIEAIMVKLDNTTELPAGLTLGETLKVIHTVNMYQGNLIARIGEIVAPKPEVVKNPIDGPSYGQAEVDNGR